ncbi:MAG: LysR substrate-binding domain-containing protein [Actinobacteria bacterium]|nr:LysR substrate-binding domain-containing protein [Actinomycetota bacterium]
MDLYHLQTFHRVAQSLNFSRAAEELSLSQSAVSRHIEALEQEHGMELFIRTGRGVTLTEAGLRLLEYTERILHLSEEATRALAELRDLESGRLTVSASTTPGNYLLGPVVAAYQDRYPGIDLRLDIRDSHSVARLVEEGTVDMAVLAEPLDGVAISTEPCIEDELLLVAAPGHPLANKPEVRLEDLTNTRVFLREPGSHTRQTVERAFRTRGLDLLQTRELGSTEAIKRTVAAGGGVAFLSRYAVALEVRAGMLKALVGQNCRLPRQLVLAYPKGGRRPPAVLAFAALLRKMRSTLEGGYPDYEGLADSFDFLFSGERLSVQDRPRRSGAGPAPPSAG